MIEVTIPFTEEAFIYLKDAGYYQNKSRGNEVYGLKDLKEWDHLLGKKWYLRVLNKWMDFCYVNVATVQFYLRQRKEIEEPDFNAMDQNPHVPCFQRTEGSLVRCHMIKCCI